MNLRSVRVPSDLIDTSENLEKRDAFRQSSVPSKERESYIREGGTHLFQELMREVSVVRMKLDEVLDDEAAVLRNGIEGCRQFTREKEEEKTTTKKDVDVRWREHTRASGRS